MTGQVDVVVADAVDGRFVPGLTVHLAAARDGRTFAAQQAQFRWRPSLHRYVADLRLEPGAYDVTVRIAAPGFARDGLRYAEPVVLPFKGVPLVAY